MVIVVGYLMHHFKVLKAMLVFTIPSAARGLSEHCQLYMFGQMNTEGVAVGWHYKGGGKKCFFFLVL